MELKDYIERGIEARRSINTSELQEVAEILHHSIVNGHKLVAFGNGGSAADAQHLVAELVGRFMMERESLPAVALTTNPSIITAIGNDYSFEDVFSRQVRSMVADGDFVVGISTSGNSANVIRAIEAAREKGAFTLALTGKGGGRLRGRAERTIEVNSDITPIIQEVHTSIVHMMCLLLDDLIQRDKKEKV